jgi:hypothetical protein
VCIYTYTHTHVQSSGEPTENFWHTIIFYTTRNWIKRNGQLLSTEQAVYYLCITLERYHLEGGLLHLQNTVVNDSQNCGITRRNSSSLVSATSSRILRFSFYIVRGRFLYTNSFQYPYKKKSGIARSGDRTGHGIPDIYENGFRRSLTRYILHRSIVTEEVSKWRDVFSSSACRLCVRKCVCRPCATLDLLPRTAGDPASHY